MVITSTSNQKVKRLVELKKKRKARDEAGLFLAEGVRMTSEVPAGFLREIYVSEEFYEKEERWVDRIRKESSASLEVLAEHVFQYVSDTKTPQGILCVIEQRKCLVEEVILAREDRNPLLLILDNVQDPGNLGTILRTAEGAGITGVVMSRDCVDIYNPKTIRATMGSVFRIPFCYSEQLNAVIEQIKKAGIRTFAAHLKGKSDYDDQDYCAPAAFMIGNEGNGLSKEIADLADVFVKIPMEGNVESLNAAIASAVLMFEAGRQRRHLRT